MPEKAKKNKPNRRPRKSPLSRKKILSMAIKIADKEGIGAVSMRKLSARFRVEAMSLYNHVENKDDILSGMVDLVLGEIKFDRKPTSWKEAMRERAIATREVLGRHPWALGILESRPNPGPETLDYHDGVLGVLFDAGFNLALAGHAFSALDAYPYGFILSEDALPFDNPEQLQMMAASILASFPVGAYPHLKRLTLEHVLRPGYSYEAEFLYGLDLLLEVLDSRLKK